MTKKKKNICFLCSNIFISPEIVLFQKLIEWLDQSLPPLHQLLSHAASPLIAASQIPCSPAFQHTSPSCSLSHLFGSFSFTNSPALENCCTGSLGKHCCDIIFLLNINKEIIWHSAAGLEANPIDFRRLKHLFEPAAFHCLATWAPNCWRLLWWWLSNTDILSKRWSRASAILTPQLQGFPPLLCLLFGNMK